MICADLEMLGADDISGIAEHVAQAQVKQIKSGIRKVARRLGPACPRVAAGSDYTRTRSAAFMNSTIPMTEGRR